MPPVLKEAMLRTHLKNPSIGHNIYMNFRPVSNLRFLSKIIEKVVAQQLTSYIENNGLHESIGI